MKNALALLIAFAVASTTFADDIRFAPGTTVTANATVTLVADSSGQLQFSTLNRSEPITIVGDTPTPTPPGPVNPTADRAKAIKESALAANDPATARDLASVYAGIASQIHAGAFTSQSQLENAVELMTAIALSGPVKSAKWKPTRELVESYWVRVAQGGGTMTDYAKLLTEAATGLEAASPNFLGDGADNVDAAISKLASAEAIDFSKIMQIIQILTDGTPMDLAKILKIVMLIIGGLT